MVKVGDLVQLTEECIQDNRGWKRIHRLVGTVVQSDHYGVTVRYGEPNRDNTNEYYLCPNEVKPAASGIPW